MLVISRFLDEKTIFDLTALVPLIDSDPERLRQILGNRIEVRVVGLRHRKARIGIIAPVQIPIHREEVQRAIDSEQRDRTEQHKDNET